MGKLTSSWKVLEKELNIFPSNEALDIGNSLLFRRMIKVPPVHGMASKETLETFQNALARTFQVILVGIHYEVLELLHLAGSPSSWIILPPQVCMFVIHIDCDD